MENLDILERAKIGRYGATQIAQEELNQVTEVLTSGLLFRYDSNNTKSGLLEDSIKNFYGINHALLLCNGSAALKAAMVAVGIKKGDEVLVTPYTFIATVNSIISLGGIPVFVDINEDLSINLEDAKRKISDKTVAIITVHIQGDATNIEAESEFCKNNKIIFIEDCAQAFGSMANGNLVGKLSSVGCFSLQSNKLITSGEGGFIITNDKEIYQLARNFHDQGGNRDTNADFANWDNPMALFGENLKISEVQSAIALAQIKKVDTFTEKLRLNRAFITENVKDNNVFRLRKCVDANGSNGVSIPFIVNKSEDRDKVIEFLSKKSIPVISLYEKLIYEFKLYQNAEKDVYWKSDSADCKNAEDLKNRMFWINNSLEYTQDELNYIVETINSMGEEVI